MNLTFDHNRVDLIGDIHGFAAELEELLVALGYDPDTYSHPEDRRLVFLGDYIDRGPEIVRTLEIVKGFCDSGCAAAIMGNHEYNAVAITTEQPDKHGEYFRPHSPRNIAQYFKTQAEFSKLADGGESWLNWFKTLPVFIEALEFRAVHACWHPTLIEYWGHHRQAEGITLDLLQGAIHEPEIDILTEELPQEHLDFWAIETLMKGVEFPLPDGHFFYDKSNISKRRSIRVKWWQELSGYRKVKDIGMSLNDDNPENHQILDLELEFPEYFNFQKVLAEKPIFFGHYWMRGEIPYELAPNAICLDWSVAAGGYLCAYRLDKKEFFRA